eukprot:7277149-Prymnesium_polylepis.2
MACPSLIWHAAAQLDATGARVRAVVRRRVQRVAATRRPGRAAATRQAAGAHAAPACHIREGDATLSATRQAAGAHRPKPNPWPWP